MKFPIAIQKDHTSDYCVMVPDLPGCYSAGDTMEDAAEMAKEAIQCHMQGLILDGDPIPEPKPMAEHMKNKDFDGSIWMVIEMDPMKISGRAKRINITIPEMLLTRMDNFAQSQGETRSVFLVKAALQAMATKIREIEV